MTTDIQAVKPVAEYPPELGGFIAKIILQAFLDGRETGHASDH